MRTTFDFAPLWRSTIGFDHLADLVDSTMRQSNETITRLTISNDPARITIASRLRWPASGSTTFP
jgi:hypothetical protein